mmetsp:Transcript_30995/g.30535  ORF Transcript_30995/g.30535 Transcript_30995/m.30535 type:complete len:179 (-) Transcript_30995:257-793(-)|eukprot:CAMPEP_0197006498 /NCGR_PEP_ID=MMETSP1380-20130617/35387_1 /TAXON_ID=5936 /ORGANISM="Euplotes crassus, Strain CT5" /LENGTH=178 /DNA_ID=CAMNT_0042426105 /DNA_START=1 /DNA_END=537 /DNA_ORIENTATION=+
MEAALEAGKYYEYSQQAKSKFFKFKLRSKEKEMKDLVNTVMEKLVASGEKSLIRDWGEYYFENWIKDTKEFDEFFFKISKLAFIHGDKENKYSFLKRMINASKNKTGQLSELMAETCMNEKQYLKAYVYSLKANKPYMTIELLNNHIIKEGYTNEVDLFKIRAVLEYISFGLIGSAQI